MVPVLVRTGSAGLPDAADIEERDFSSSSPRQRRSTRRCEAEPSLYDDMVYLVIKKVMGQNQPSQRLEA